MSETGQTFPSGILDLAGCTSGEAFQYDALSVSDMTIFMVHFESTYEAIEKHILPPPLKADRSPPPQVQMWYFSSRNTLAMDGRITPYNGFQFGSDSILMQLWCSMAAISSDLPLAGRAVKLLATVRRFRCKAIGCGQRSFTERFPDGVLVPWARRTSRLDGLVHHLGLALGGRPAANLARRLMLPSQQRHPASGRPAMWLPIGQAAYGDRH